LVPAVAASSLVAGTSPLTELARPYALLASRANSFSPATQSYTPHDKEWLKERILYHLRKAAGL